MTTHARPSDNRPTDRPLPGDGVWPPVPDPHPHAVEVKPPRKKPSVENAKALLKLWLPQFGFGHYRWSVKVLPAKLRKKADDPECWAHCCWMHKDEYALFEFMPDDTWKNDELEQTVLHELAHGLVDLAETGEHNVEVVCTRIADLVMGKRVKGINERLMEGKWNKVGEGALELASPRDQWLALLTEGLPDPESLIITRIFWSRDSLADISRDTGKSRRTIARIRDRALVNLRTQLAEVEKLGVDV